MSEQSGEHVHYWDDGRGRREVFIDGQRVDGVRYCDTKVGIAVVVDTPLKSTDGEHVDFHPVWGEIRVIYCGGYTRANKTFRMGEGPIQ
ncbi:MULTISPECIES: hypothetical protein [Pseudomonas]|jgi:hypothetical protein|nr:MULTISPECIES: hypothetical protein [Pseudomonas]AOZ14958.1 hypothetical protein AA042_21655 [Pseudomonas lundensis]MBM1184114.1 hypothetical protein [Pseudomonas lundensis]MBS5839472.1 hypothetical protein [Pseudomonas sp.]NNA02833.1 hypothetical protein [Pseudomonas lundensis]NNA20445.1 hypothetical protein [Pseudomonas lundensis]